MRKYIFHILPALLLSVACAQPSQSPPRKDPPLQVSSKPSAPTNPPSEMVRLAEKIHTRLRYFGEEIKTTYKPDSRNALLANVRETVHPSCEGMKKIIESEPPANDAAAKEMAAVCDRMDAALEKRDLDLLRTALRDFTPAYEKLKTTSEGGERKAGD